MELKLSTRKMAVIRCPLLRHEHGNGKRFTDYILGEMQGRILQNDLPSELRFHRFFFLPYNGRQIKYEKSGQVAVIAKNRGCPNIILDNEDKRYQGQASREVGTTYSNEEKAELGQQEQANSRTLNPRQRPRE